MTLTKQPTHLKAISLRRDRIVNNALHKKKVLYIEYFTCFFKTGVFISVLEVETKFVVQPTNWRRSSDDTRKAFLPPVRGSGVVLYGLLREKFTSDLCDQWRVY